MALVSEAPETRPADLGGTDRRKPADRLRSNRDRAAVCSATGQMLPRHTGCDAERTRAMREACATARGARRDTCAEQTRTAHRATRAEACRERERARREPPDSLGRRPRPRAAAVCP